MSITIVVTGMHRSGTSLISSLLQEAGVNVGTELFFPNAANPRGYFEDKDFYEFHEQALQQRGRNFLVTDEFLFDPTPEESQQAGNLISQRRVQPIWGWKDPRTTLFLDFWHRLVPDARILFLYRHPFDVLCSLTRRGDFDYYLDLLNGLKSWHIYNTRIKDFYKRHQDICVLGHIYTVVDQFDRFCSLLGHKSGLHLNSSSVMLESLYHPQELHRGPITDQIEAIVRGVCPETIALYEELDALADLPSDANADVFRVKTPDISTPLGELAEELSAQDAHNTVDGNLLLLLLVSMADIRAARNLFERHSNCIKYLEHQGHQLRLELETYEQLLQSQDLLTRHYVRLTLNNLGDPVRHPARIKKKLWRWFYYRVMGGGGTEL